MRFIKRISDRGILTLPNDLREALDIQEGDIVEFEVVDVHRKAGRASRATAAPGHARVPTRGEAA